MARTKLQTHLTARGSMTRKNPELLRLSKVTGLSVEHLFHVALGRKASRPAAMAIHKAAKNPDLSIDEMVEGVSKTNGSVRSPAGAGNGARG